jgi:hypothetical protein
MWPIINFPCARCRLYLPYFDAPLIGDVVTMLMRICIVQPASNGTMHFSCCSPGLYSGLCCYGWLRTCNIFCEMFIASPVHFYVPPKLISSVQLTTRSRRSHSRSELRSTEVNRGLWLRLNPKSELQLSWQYRN